MNQENTAENGVKKVYIKIPIPAYNDYLLKDMKHWAKRAYHNARVQVSRRRAQKIKEIMPIETAAYAEDKVFGNWRLVAPDGPDKISPLQSAIGGIRDEIVPTRWGEFRRNFVREIKIDFNAISDSDYDPKMVDEVNGRLNKLVNEYTRGGITNTPRPDVTSGHPSQEGILAQVPSNKRGFRGVYFVLKPETAEDYSSLKNLTIRSGIWMRWTGEPLDFSQFIKPPGAKPLSRQMEMFLELSLTVGNRGSLNFA